MLSDRTQASCATPRLTYRWWQETLDVLGGLTSFGGAGNNYSMHALTEMTRQLREGKGKTALVLCNGGVLSHQYVVILSREPRKGGDYPTENLLPQQITDVPLPELLIDAEGEALWKRIQLSSIATAVRF